MRSLRALFLTLALFATACGQAEQAPPASSEPPAAADTAAQTPDARVFCAEIGRRVTPADCEDYMRLAQSAERGAAAFNAPDPMRRGATHVLQLAVSYAPPAARAEPPAAASPAPEEVATSITPEETVEPLPGETVTFTPLVGRFMRAELSGVGFDITPQSPPAQEVAPDSVTTWTWSVVAREGGQRALTLTTVVEGCTSDGGECVPLRSTTRNVTVNVEVSRLGQARDFLAGMPNWIKLASAIVLAIAGLITASLALRNAVRRTRGGA